MVDDAVDPNANDLVDDEDATPEATPPAGRAAPPSPRLPRIDRGRMWFLAAVIGVALAGDVLVYAFISGNAEPGVVGFREVIALIGGFGTLALLLYLGTLILRALDLATPTEALGMPEGSIRALIAMSLILIFAITGFVVLRSAGGQSAQSHGLTQTQIDTIRAGGAAILSQNLLTPAPGEPVPSAGGERYDVTTVQPLNPDSHDFALQLLTTVSTLVVAVAGFYFGAKSVSAAAKVIQDQQTGLLAWRAPRPVPPVVGTTPETPTDASLTNVDPNEPPETTVDDVSQPDPADAAGASGDGTP